MRLKRVTGMAVALLVAIAGDAQDIYSSISEVLKLGGVLRVHLDAPLCVLGCCGSFVMVTDGTDDLMLTAYNGLDRISRLKPGDCIDGYTGTLSPDATTATTSYYYRIREDKNELLESNFKILDNPAIDPHLPDNAGIDELIKNRFIKIAGVTLESAKVTDTEGISYVRKFTRSKTPHVLISMPDGMTEEDLPTGVPLDLVGFYYLNVTSKSSGTSYRCFHLCRIGASEVTVGVTTEGNGSIWAGNSEGVSNCSVEKGQPVTLHAKPSQGYRFGWWENEKGFVSDRADHRVYPTDDASYKAVFLTDDDSEVLIDGMPYNRDTETTGNVTYVRRFNNTHWQPLYVPFDMEYSDWATFADVAEINTAHQSEADGATELEFRTVLNGRITPNRPYIIRAKETGLVTFTCNNCDIEAAPDEEGSVDCSSATHTFTFRGIYETKSDMKTSGAYALSSGYFAKVANDDITLRPMRFYLLINSRESVSESDTPRALAISVDGVTTSIDGLLTAPPRLATPLFDLQGRPVENPTTGIYIREGRKIFIP